MCNHLGQFGLARSWWAIEQDIDARFLACHRMGEQVAKNVNIGLHKAKVFHAERRGRARACEDRHQLRLVAVGTHQYRWQLLADLHQVGQISDVVLRDQVFNQADALQPGPGAQGFGHLRRADASHFGNGGEGFGRVVHLELNQQAAHVALVASKGAVQQDGALGLVQLQQTGQGVDVALHQGAVALDGATQPLLRGRKHGHDVLVLLLGIFVEEKVHGGFVKGTAPQTESFEEVGRRQRLVSAPQFVTLTALRQKLPQAHQHRLRPHQMPPNQR